MLQGSKHLPIAIAAGLGLAVIALTPACGRIGLQLGAPLNAGADAGSHVKPQPDAQTAAADGGTIKPDGDGGADAAPRGDADAATALDAGRDAAAGNDASRAPDALGEACGSATDCGSGHCVAAICCAQVCDTPPTCHTASGASCAGGHACSYPIDAAASCSDGDACTTGDSCASGSCTGTAIDCSDNNACTTDYCSAGACHNVNNCSPGAGCTYYRNGAQGFWLCAGPSDWSTGESSCNAVGLHLASIDSQAEHDFLWSKAGNADTWIGYSDAAQEGIWVWRNGDASTYTHWNPGTPTANTGLNCARMTASATGLWSDQDCSQAAHFWCEYPGKSPPDPTCTYAVHAGHGYWICETPQQWDEARMHCQGVGLNLVTIGDAGENTFLQSQLQSASYYIGYSDAAVEGTYVWADGTPSGFTNWASGEPKNAVGNEDFAVIAKSTGTWSASANNTLPYVCEDPAP